MGFGSLVQSTTQKVVLGAGILMFVGMGIGNLPLIGLGGLVIGIIVVWKTRGYKERRYRRELQHRHETYGYLWNYREEEHDRRRFGI